MRYRTTTLLAYQPMPVAAGTLIVDIPITDVISAFHFHFAVQRGAGRQIGQCFDTFPKIELVDGSDVLMELSGAQMDAIHFFERRQLGNATVGEISGHLDHFYTAVYFGRWPYDQELALDPRKFVNPQLRITYNTFLYEATAGLIPSIAVFADIFDELRPSPIGFLQMREFYRYTQPAAIGFTWVNLPTDLVLRKIIVQPHLYGILPSRILTDARLDEDNMKRIPFDLLFMDWRAANAQEYGPVEQGISGTRQGAGFPLYNAVAEAPMPVWQEVEAAPVLQLIGAPGCELLMTDFIGDTTTFIGHTAGLLPYFSLCYQFGWEKDLADWYETKDIGTLRLRLNTTAAFPVPGPASIRVILQQMRRY